MTLGPEKKNTTWDIIFFYQNKLDENSHL